MPLILAIEPDRKQAARVTALARGLPGAELLLADSTGQALASLDGRVPNLILTSLLLSPKDEAGLRALNGAGAPVPTLMIPVFATGAAQPSERGGFLARLPWSRSGTGGTAPGTTGCDPSVFASQIWEYLQSTAIEDETNEEEVRLKPDTPYEPETRHEPERADEPDATAQDVEGCPALAGPVIEESGWDEITINDEETSSPIELSETTIELSGETIDLRAFVQELEAAEREFATPQVLAIEVAAAEPIDIVDEPAIDEILVTEPAASMALPAASMALQEAPMALQAAPMAQPAASMAAVIEDEAPRVTVVHALPDHPSWPPLEGVLAEELSHEELLAIVADFEAALEDEPDTPGTVDADSDLWMPLSVGGSAAWPRLENAYSGPRAHQDEWGFFDPEQCGFSALIAKLDQIAK